MVTIVVATMAGACISGVRTTYDVEDRHGLRDSHGFTKEEANERVTRIPLILV